MGARPHYRIHDIAVGVVIASQGNRAARVRRRDQGIDSGRDRRWISTSLGYGGRRLYVFDADGRRFPTDRFRGEIQHWIRRESMEIQERGVPREGPGCWHPLFPARYDAIMMMAACKFQRP